MQIIWVQKTGMIFMKKLMIFAAFIVLQSGAYAETYKCKVRDAIIYFRGDQDGNTPVEVYKDRLLGAPVRLDVIQEFGVSSGNMVSIAFNIQHPEQAGNLRFFRHFELVGLKESGSYKMLATGSGAATTACSKTHDLSL